MNTFLSTQLSSSLYEELRTLAEQEMARERSGHTLQPTALVNEAYLRLVSGQPSRFESRAHFFGAAAIAIRRVLVEHARKRACIKRGERANREGLDEVEPSSPMPEYELLDVDQALVNLAAFAPDHARIVELRFFAGMSLPEIAAAREVSISTVQRQWRLARAWLQRQLGTTDAC